MKNFTHFLQNTKIRILLVVMLCALGTFLFQAQDSNNQGSIDNPNLDQLPYDPMRYAYMPSDPPLDLPPETVNGYDNWNLGITYAEPHSSVNPRNPLWFFNASNINTSFYTINGFDWNNSYAPFPSTSGDPWTAYDSLGNLYYQSMKSPITGTWVVKSTNNGETWGGAVSGVNGGDRNTMACDQTGGPYRNYIYQAMTASGFSSANFARSTDGGQSFVQTFTGTPHNLPGVMIAVGPNGTVQGGSVYFVTYSGANSNGTYNFFLSTDGGASFNYRSSISGISYIGTEIGGRSTINGIRTRPYPMIAADNSYGPYRGRFYIVWANNDPPGNGMKPDIFLKYSTDQGLNWSNTVTVNDNANPSATNQWFPAVWCDKNNGKLWIKWYDMRNDPNNTLVDVYGTWTTNGGASFVANQRITNMSWNYPGPACPGTISNYRGDYDAISANSTTSLSVWYDARNSNCGNYVGYFPDFAMTALPPALTLNGINDSGFVRVSVPGVKLYTDKAKFSATISPNPGSGTITLTFLNRSTPALQDSLTSYPDSLRLRIKTSGGVTQQSYTVTITGKGSNGSPIHKRTMTLSVVTGITSNNNEIPQDYYLYQNFPNPFNPSTNIRFDMPKAGNVKLIVYDITGKQVTQLVNENLSAGKHTVDFDAANISSGIYFYKIETPEFTSIRKMILVK